MLVRAAVVAALVLLVAVLAHAIPAEAFLLVVAPVAVIWIAAARRTRDTPGRGARMDA